MAHFSLEIITPEGLAFQAEVYEVILPTPAGYIAILPHHTPLISLLTAGIISVRREAEDKDTELEHLATAGGFVEIHGKRVRLLTNTAEAADSLDALRIQEALEKARALRRQARDDIALAEAMALIEHQSARLKVADLRRRRTSRIPSPTDKK